jgi:hypothetical protein
MDAKAILADLRDQFGKGRAVLYPEDLAVALNKSPKAVDSLIRRGSLPLKVKPVGGRNAVSIYEVAEWFASEEQPETHTARGSVAVAKSKPPAPRPSRIRRPSLGRALLALRAQQDFVGELIAELDAIEVARAAKKTDKTKPRKPPL